MERLALPGSRVAVTRIGLGCARLFGGAELRASASLIEAALRTGIRHFDTAPAYGSEDVLGAVLAGVTDVTIATKVGLPRARDSAPSRRAFFGSIYRRTLRPALARTPGLKAGLLRLATGRSQAAAARPRRRLDRDEVLRELSESLRRLQRSSIDLYLLHEPDGLEITDEDRLLFASLQEQGVIGAFGLAYGDEGRTAVPFGTTTQRRYARGSAAEPHAGCARLYHGIVRHAAGQRPAAARALVRQALHDDPHCGVIFSASSHWQISDIAAG